MIVALQFVKENSAWIVPIFVSLIGGVGWIIKRRLEHKPQPSQVQTISGKSVGIQVGRDAKVIAGKKK